METPKMQAVVWLFGGSECKQKPYKPQRWRLTDGFVAIHSKDTFEAGQALHLAAARMPRRCRPQLQPHLCRF